MSFREFLNIAKNKKQTIFSIVLLFLVFTAVLTFIQPFKYLSQSKILVIQDAPAGIDPYQVAKANEYVANTLSKVIVSNSFFNEVMNSGFNVNRNYFPADPKKQLKEWKKTVHANSANNSGIIDLLVFHPDKYQADQIIRGINKVLEEKHKYYHGSGDQVSIRIIDQPFSSAYPVQPNIPLNFAMGALLGFVFAFSYIYLFPEEEYNLRLLPSRKRKAKKQEEQKLSPEEVYEAIERLRQEKQAGNVEKFRQEYEEKIAPTQEQRNPHPRTKQNFHQENKQNIKEKVAQRASMENLLK